MRSLSARLVLAFALTSLVGIGLAALFVRQFVTNQFDSYVLEESQGQFVTLAENYYAAHGSWDGISSAELSEAYGHRGGHGRDDSTQIAFTLVDVGSRIVVSPNASQRGTLADPQQLSQAVPVLVNGATVGTVYLSGTPGRSTAAESYLAGTDLALGAAALIAVLVALALGALLARLVTRPVRDLTNAARQIASGELGQQVPVRSRDELGLLASQFNAMSADLARATELRQRMTADIAHDLRTPLTVIAGYLEALRDEGLRPTPARFTAMYDETQVLLRLVEDLHTLSLADAGELVLRRQRVDPAQLLARVAQTYGDVAARAGVELHVEVASGLPLLDVDAEQLTRALGNLVSNALRYTPPGGQVTLRAERAPGGVALVVADTGIGIAAEHLPNLFERFYRADASRHQVAGGSGLGLAIVRSIIEAHGGEVAVRSTVGKGTTFTGTLPAA